MNLMENMGLAPKENKREIKLISYDKLIASPDNFYNTNDVSELKQAILLAGGVRQNLIVKPDSNGGYMIISGHRRYKAVLELLKEGANISEDLPCEIETDPDVADLLLITTNSTTRRLTDWERLEQFERLEKLYEKWKAEGKTTQTKRDTLAKMLGDSRTGIARIQAISNNLIFQLKDCLKDGVLGISIAYEASQLPQEKQEDFYHKCCLTGQFDLNAVRTMVRKEKAAVEAAEAEQKTIENYTGGETIKQTVNYEDAEYLPQERREYIPLKKWTGCEIMLRTMKIDGEYDTIVQYTSPLNSGERNIGRYPNIASARSAAIEKVKDLDKCMRTALADAGLIDKEGIPTYSKPQKNIGKEDEWEDTPEETNETEQPLNDEYAETAPQGNKRTGEYYDKCLKKMEEDGIEALEPCERCTLATACEKCCKTCTERCNAMQNCYKDIAEANKRKREDEPDEIVEEPNETVEDFIKRVKKMRHPRRTMVRGEGRFPDYVNILGDNACFEIGAKDEIGEKIREMDIVISHNGAIGVIVYKADELAYGIAVRGQMEYVDSIFGADIKIIGNLLTNPEVLENG